MNYLFALLLLFVVLLAGIILYPYLGMDDNPKDRRDHKKDRRKSKS